ncbi:hypothetical protein [uncultured Novosphingobium sp.]|uniref:hypothetical protein n=1 Tax=uncultured Novosphingobium sp. TaxID=292277 RepID=UPI00258E45D3|nr:hypothetical protein [uncultured Novosphingobium sp.]
MHETRGLAPLLLDRWIGDFSAGMRQRIAIAVAFAGSHFLVILDKPFNWLDPVAIFDLREVLRDRVDGGLTLITAHHDLGTLASICDAGLMLADDKVVLALDERMLRIAAQTPRAFERQTIDRLGVMDQRRPTPSVRSEGDSAMTPASAPVSSPSSPWTR